MIKNPKTGKSKKTEEKIMMNYYELFNAIKDTDAKMVLLQNFKEAFAENYKAMQANNTTRKQARKSYFSDEYIRTDKDVKGVYTNGTSILVLNDEINEYGKECHIAEHATEVLKGAQEEEFCHIKASIAVARSLGWKPNDTKYLIEIDGAWYNLSLVYKLYSCIAVSDKDGYMTVKQKKIDNRITDLILQTQYGTAIILPVLNHCNKDYDCSYNHFVEVEKAIEEESYIPFN
jgi:hypothetical protein